MGEIKTYKYNNRFTLETGVVLPEVEIAYSTYGTMNAKRSNIIWVCHALTANSCVDDWWEKAVKKDNFLDPERYFVVCANVLGSHYGTTGPLSVNPITNEEYYKSFPSFTMRDVVNCHILLAEHLGITSVDMLVGGSIGGFQILEWLIAQPTFAKKAVIIATTAKTEPWAIAFNESQRMAIECDPTFYMKSTDGGAKGLECARSIAMLSYRCNDGYNITQKESEYESAKLKDYKASSYQRYQGEKLAARFNAFSYYRLTQAVDSHDVGRGRRGVENALALIKAKCAIVAISSDILYPVESHVVMHKYIKNSSLYIINSRFGHDGFLIEHDQLEAIIKELQER
ncbi:MAG: homoserine O-acetyltransferase [Rikenellaceae bacterium]